MHAFIEADMGDKPALQPKAAIGPAVRAIAGHVIDTARAAITDPERSNQDAVHDFRRAMKEWRALMRLLAPFIPDAVRWRPGGARPRPLARACARRPSALNAFDDLLDKGMVLSARSTATIRGRLEAMRGSEEQAVLTPDAARCDHRLARCRDRRGRAVAARSVRIQRHRRAPAAGYRSGAALYPGRLGRTPAPKTCIICASASSIIAIRWI